MTPDGIPFDRALSDFESIVWDYHTTDHGLRTIRSPPAPADHRLGLPHAAAAQRMPTAAAWTTPASASSTSSWGRTSMNGSGWPSRRSRSWPWPPAERVQRPPPRRRVDMAAETRHGAGEEEGQGFPVGDEIGLGRARSLSLTLHSHQLSQQVQSRSRPCPR